jgi:transcriptional regulator with PAS, ATPase and Fis domain
LPQHLLENELFGSVRGAFTGAERSKIGYVEAADGGTLFLDEVGELPLAAQVRLLNVLERREVRRLGTLEVRPVDVRILSATHRNLSAAVQAEAFRADLYYRLSGFTLTVPPLRERPADIGPLVEKFVRDCAERDGTPRAEVDPSALRALVAHRWPGNVRELRNAVEHAVVLAGGERIVPQHLPASIGR